MFSVREITREPWINREIKEVWEFSWVHFIRSGQSHFMSKIDLHVKNLSISGLGKARENEIYRVFYRKSAFNPAVKCGFIRRLLTTMTVNSEQETSLSNVNIMLNESLNWNECKSHFFISSAFLEEKDEMGTNSRKTFEKLWKTWWVLQRSSTENEDLCGFSAVWNQS